MEITRSTAEKFVTLRHFLCRNLPILKRDILPPSSRYKRGTVSSSKTSVYIYIYIYIPKYNDDYLHSYRHANLKSA